jgi:hypothetical protein
LFAILVGMYAEIVFLSIARRNLVNTVECRREKINFSGALLRFQGPF